MIYETRTWQEDQTDNTPTVRARATVHRCRAIIAISFISFSSIRCSLLPCGLTFGSVSYSFATACDLPAAPMNHRLCWSLIVGLRLVQHKLSVDLHRLAGCQVWHSSSTDHLFRMWIYLWNCIPSRETWATLQRCPNVINLEFCESNIQMAIIKP